MVVTHKNKPESRYTVIYIAALSVLLDGPNGRIYIRPEYFREFFEPVDEDK